MSQDFDPIYQEYILDLYRHPHNQGVISEPDFTSEEFNPSCGDKIGLMLRINEGVIADAKHQGQGCAISQAGVSLLTDWLKGKKVSEAKALTAEAMIALLGIPISHTRYKCATLGWLTLQKALWITGSWKLNQPLFRGPI